MTISKNLNIGSHMLPTESGTAKLGDSSHKWVIDSSQLSTVAVSKGGTGKTSITSGSYLVGNGTGAVAEKTASQVYNDIKSYISIPSAYASGSGAPSTSQTAPIYIDTAKMNTSDPQADAIYIRIG